MKKCIKRFVSLGLLFGAFVFSFDKVNAMMRSDGFFEPKPMVRGCKNAKGIHTDEYYEAAELYRANPLTNSQIQCLDKWFKGHCRVVLLTAAQHIADNDRRRGLRRIEKRQELALWAWYSKNWNGVKEYAKEICDIAGEIDAIQDIEPKMFEVSAEIETPCPEKKSEN